MQKIGHILGANAEHNDEFVEADPANNIEGTIAKAAWFNSVQHELVAVVEKFGGVLDSRNDGQFWDTINRIALVRPDSRLKQIRPVCKIPYYPEILTLSAVLAITTNDDNTIRIDPEQFFVWRGVWKINTSDYNEISRTFLLIPNAIFHLRWNAKEGFVVKNLQDVNYNSGGLTEHDASFDTTHDDMLIARVATDGNATPTITLLKNRHSLRTTWHSEAIPCWVGLQKNQHYRDTPEQASHMLNWSRSPMTYFLGVSGFNLGSQSRTAPASNRHGFGTAATRYAVSLYNAVEAMNAGQINKTRWHVNICA